MSAALAAHAAGQARALVVDDSPFLALQLSCLLSAQGFEPHVCVDAGELRKQATAASVIFIELELFEANGFEVTRELSAQCSCPLVLLTGTGRHTDLQWGLRAGAAAVLARPVTDQALRAVMRKVGCGGLS